MIDLRSDTCSVPDEEMRQAMANARVGNESLGEDPTVNQLVDEACRAVGKEAGLFMASGTMANLVALLTHADAYPSGSEVVMAEHSHCYWYEAAGVSRLAGLCVRPIRCGSEYLTADKVREALRPVSAQTPRSALLWLEDTYMLGGGLAIPPAQLKELYDLTREKGMSIHMDGARIFNAAYGLGVPASEIAKYTDSVQFCFSKGLGAPFGSVLCGSKEFIERARHNRTMVGGNMRQAGIMAAAALLGLHRAEQQIPEDNRNARRLAQGLSELFPGSVDVRDNLTNIVLFDAEKAGMGQEEFCAWMAEREIMVSTVPTVTGTACRFVTYNGVSAADIETVLNTASELVGRN